MPTPTALPAAFTAGDVLTANNMNLLRGGFRILQVVQGTTTTLTTTTSQTFVTTTLTATITPSAASNKVLVIATIPVKKVTDSVFSAANTQIFRGTVAGTALTTTLLQLFVEKPVAANQTMQVLDTPNTTSAQTYTVGLSTGSSLVTVETCTSGFAGTILLMEVSA